MPITMATNAQLGSVTLSAAASTALSGVAVLTLTCDILANQGGPNGIGGQLDNWQPVATNVPCSVLAKTPGVDKTEGEKITAIGIYAFVLPSSVAITPANRIRFAGYVFIVQDRDIPTPDKATVGVRVRLIE